MIRVLLYAAAVVLFELPAFACQQGDGLLCDQVITASDQRLTHAREICVRRWYFPGGEYCDGTPIVGMSYTCDLVVHPAHFTTPECVAVDRQWKESGAARREDDRRKTQDEQDEQYVKSVAGIR